MAPINWVGCAIVDGPKLLAVWKTETAQYEIPGGKLEENESLEEGAKREVKEEIGVDVEITRYLGDKETFRNGKTYHSHNYLAKLKKGEIPKITETKKFRDIIWIDLQQNLINSCSENIKELFGLYKSDKLI